MRVLATVFSILLLAWMIAGMPLQFVKVRTLAEATKAGDVPYVDAQFTPVVNDEEYE